MRQKVRKEKDDTYDLYVYLILN